VVYAIVLGWPAEPFVIQSLGSAGASIPGKIEHVQLLGMEQKISWKQTATGLRVILPKQYRPKRDYAAALKISLALFIGVKRPKLGNLIYYNDSYR
jgi:hypothetical protein